LEQQNKKENLIEKKITETLEENYMPYAMSVIVSRAIPGIDGFKPSHRKLLYTMYKMGLLTSQNRTKSANVVGQTMQLNPHGDAAIYETMVRLTRSNEALLCPFVDSKGNFGKQYSRDMAYAASRYTEVKLEGICREIFKDLEKDAVDFADNYDSTKKEPVILPAAFPNILVNPNQGIAVGMASSICSFNLKEVCETAIQYIKDPSFDLALTLKAPDFPTGGELLYDERAIREIYETGKGSVTVRCRYSFDKKNNCIDIVEIPYTTTSEAICDKVVELVKTGKIKEISDIRDETDLSGLKITVDLKRGTDPDKLMQRLFKMTPLQDVFSCNFNILIGDTPNVYGVGAILEEWLAFRIECIKRVAFFDRKRAEDRLHLLKGLQKILLDIDKAIAVIRDTPEDNLVIPNLMAAFGIDEIQAQFIAEIKLRNLNKKYVLDRLADIKGLEEEIRELTALLGDHEKIKKKIVAELQEILKKYGSERKTQILYDLNEPDIDHEEFIEDYPVTLFLSKEGYFKKITPQSLRMQSEQKFKDGDSLYFQAETTNKAKLLVFTDRCQVYKARVFEFEDVKASVLGDYLPAKLSFDEGEKVLFMAVTNDFSEELLLFFKDGKCARFDLSAYDTKTNRKKLTGAFSDRSPVVAGFAVPKSEEKELVLCSSAGKVLLVSSGAIPKKSTRTTQGVAVMTLKGKNTLSEVLPAASLPLASPAFYKTKNLPAAGHTPAGEDKNLFEYGKTLI